MKFLSMYLIPALLFTSNIANSEEVVHGDNYEKMVEKSIKYIEYFVQVISELEMLRDRLSLWMRTLSHEVSESSRFDMDYKEAIQAIMKHIESLNNSLIALSNQDSNLFETSNSEIEKIIENGENEKSNRYDVILAKVAKLYGQTFRLIAKFYGVLDRLEKHVEDVSHDFRNFNSSFQTKQHHEKAIQSDINKLSKEVNSLLKVTDTEIDTYSKMLKELKSSAEQKQTAENKNEKVADGRAEDKNDKKSEKSSEESKESKLEENGEKADDKKNGDNKKTDKDNKKKDDKPDKDKKDKEAEGKKVEKTEELSKKEEKNSKNK